MRDDIKPGDWDELWRRVDALVGDEGVVCSAWRTYCQNFNCISDVLRAVDDGPASDEPASDEHRLTPTWQRTNVLVLCEDIGWCRYDDERWERIRSETGFTTRDINSIVAFARKALL